MTPQRFVCLFPATFGQPDMRWSKPRTAPQRLKLGLKGDIDLALLDQLMPAMLGTEVIAKWREAGIDFPVLVLTAVDDDDTAVRSFELGAADYVRKPFNMSELTARVNGRLRSK